MYTGGTRAIKEIKPDERDRVLTDRPPCVTESALYTCGYIRTSIVRLCEARKRRLPLLIIYLLEDAASLFPAAYYLKFELASPPLAVTHTVGSQEEVSPYIQQQQHYYCCIR